MGHIFNGRETKKTGVWYTGDQATQNGTAWSGIVQSSLTISCTNKGCCRPLFLA